MCVEMGGSITGEHGVGEWRNAILSCLKCSTHPTMEVMHRIRRAMDPLSISNPGKMFPGTEAPALTATGLHPLEKAGVISRE